MFELFGKYGRAKVFAEVADPTAVSQVIDMLNQEAFKDSKIRIMPDVHAGKGCTIGTTMTLTEKAVPNLVGVDIGCGMYTMELGKEPIDLAKLDKIIIAHVPSGYSIRDTIAIDFSDSLERLTCFKSINKERALLSIGTLGGGNHFIEVAKGGDGMQYLIIHSGSRNLGKQIAEYHQAVAIKDRQPIQKQTLIQQLKAKGMESAIQSELLLLRQENKSFKSELAYLEGQHLIDYMKDMHIAQTYAELNRAVIANVICKELGIKRGPNFTTKHNYIDIRESILRKGAVSAKKGEKLLIPMNMRDGSLLCIGKGNEDWNNSAPHGAGRLLSRSQAKSKFGLEEFVEQMEGVYTTSVKESTIDECPMAYKPMESIIKQIEPTVEIVDTLKPIYNYKAH